MFGFGPFSSELRWVIIVTFNQTKSTGNPFHHGWIPHGRKLDREDEDCVIFFLLRVPRLVYVSCGWSQAVPVFRVHVVLEVQLRASIAEAFDYCRYRVTQKTQNENTEDML